MPAFFYKLSLRIYAGAAIALLLTIGMGLFLTQQVRTAAFDMREGELARMIDVATNIVVDYHAQAEAGTLTVDEAKTQARAAVSALKYEESGYFFIFDQQNRLLVNRYRPEWIGQDKSDVKDVNGLPIFVEMNRVATQNGRGQVTYWFNKPNTDIQEPKYSHVQLFKPWGWIIGTGSYVRDIETTLADVRQKQIIMFVAGLALVMLVAVLSARSVIKPLDGLKKRMQTMSEGDVQADIPYTQDRSELGDMSRSLSVFRDSLSRQKDLEATQEAQTKEISQVIDVLSGHLSKMSRGDLDIKITQSFPKQYEQLRKDFNATLDQLQDTISKVIDVSSSIRNGSMEISQSSEDLSRRTESQAATLEQTAAALDELTASVRSAAEGARGVETTMGEARNHAEVSGGVVQNAVAAMTEIEQSSNHIAQIISVIDDIAFQTNLLALNAGVEAARAGEAGRGFAVVASEVRALAQRSSDAAMEIKKLISDSSQQVDRGVDLVGKAGEALEQIVDSVSHISTLISGIAEGAAEQSIGLGEINTGMTQLDQVTQQNAAMVEQATAAGHMLNSDASKLADLVSYFNTGKASVSRAPSIAAPAAQPTAHGTGNGQEDWDNEWADEQPRAAAGGGKGWEDF